MDLLMTERGERLEGCERLLGEEEAHREFSKLILDRKRCSSKELIV